MHEILYPLFALILLTMVVAFIMAMNRLSNVKNRKVHPRYYKTFSGERPPEREVQLNRNYTNLLEQPMLFYAAGAIILALGIQSSVLLWLSWGYVASRLVHTLIHVTYNMPLHRMIAFMVSNVFLLALWIIIMLAAGSS